MKRTKYNSKIPLLILLIGALVACLSVSGTRAQDNPNTITFDNRSGEPALVILIGPTGKSIEVPNVQNRTVNVAGGKYYLLIRYGSKPDQHSYSEGDPFTVTQTSTQYSVITITLHKVIGGNYHTHQTSREKFEKALSQSEQITREVSSSDPSPKIQTFEVPKVIEIPKIQTYEIPKVQTFEMPKIQTYEIPKIQTFEPLPKIQTIEPLPKFQTLEPIPKIQMIEPLPKFQVIEPLPKIQTIEPLPKFQAIEPLVKTPLIPPQQVSPELLKPLPQTIEARNSETQKSHLIAVLVTGVDASIVCGKLKDHALIGFELFEVKDEAEAKHERFWGILFVKHEIKTYKTMWVIRSQAEERQVGIRLRPRNNMFTTNWENLSVKGTKEPGPSGKAYDWKVVSEWAEVPPLHITIQTSDVSSVITLLKDNSAGIRAAAAKKLSELKDSRAVIPLVGVLKDEDSDVRWWAVYALEKLNDPRAVEDLIVALKDTNSVVREWAERALRKITGQNLGEDPTQWQEWWEKNKPK